ncbi:hypothetical protein JHK85_043027 [Glycine max]|nr:hypothetical protein JHK85_043027 [Glycine max]
MEGSRWRVGRTCGFVTRNPFYVRPRAEGIPLDIMVGNLIDHDEQVVNQACQFLNDWRHAVVIDGRPEEAIQSRLPVKWMPPSKGRMKCNIDAAFREGGRRMGIGACLRDDRGHCVHAFTTLKPYLPTMKEDEALAILHTLEYLKNNAPCTRVSYYGHIPDLHLCVCDVLTNGKWDLNRLKMMIPRDVRAKIKTIVPCLHSSLPNIVYLKLGIASWNWVWKASLLENIIFFMWQIFSRGLTHKTTPSS